MRLTGRRCPRGSPGRTLRRPGVNPCRGPGVQAPREDGLGGEAVEAGRDVDRLAAAAAARSSRASVRRIQASLDMATRWASSKDTRHGTATRTPRAPRTVSEMWRAHRLFSNRTGPTPSRTIVRDGRPPTVFP
jgi:hypothetical protein